MAKAPPSSPVAVPQSRTARPSGPAVPAYTLTGRKLQAEMRLHRRQPVLAVDGLHAGQPAVEHAGVGLQPLRRRHLLVLAVVQDGPPDGALHRPAEFTVAPPLADVGALHRKSVV